MIFAVPCSVNRPQPPTGAVRYRTVADKSIRHVAVRPLHRATVLGPTWELAQSRDRNRAYSFVTNLSYAAAGLEFCERVDDGIDQFRSTGWGAPSGDR